MWAMDNAQPRPRAQVASSECISFLKTFRDSPEKKLASRNISVLNISESAKADFLIPAAEFSPSVIADLLTPDVGFSPTSS